ncbi:D-alanine--D-alanine ligase [Weissella viridescens]|uniref:D-alanine--D-alanine ligase n=1 Tax=Weissella viridescens TaxID=1629 RepID=A0A380NZG9_WEIVI|nr:D-alanine--D-alanine ligase [Weissella viridescens]
MPVELDDDLAEEITTMALDAYRALGLVGLTRMDFLVDKNGVPYLGEPNTLPGFTNISLYPQMWEVSGLSYSQLIDEIIDYGLAEFERNNKLSYDFIALGDEKLDKKLQRRTCRIVTNIKTDGIVPSVFYHVWGAFFSRRFSV